MEPVTQLRSRRPRALTALAALAIFSVSLAGQGAASAAGVRAAHVTSVQSPVPVALPLGATAVPALSSPGTATSCPRVYLIGARGSGETAGGPFHGLGAAVNRILGVAAGVFKKHRQSYQTYAVNYPSLSVSVLEPKDWSRGPGYYFDHNVKRYVASITTGVSVLIKLADALHKRCSSALMMVAGYSQGGMVVHDAVNNLNGSVLACVDGVVELGDGNRVPYTKAREFGTSPKKGEGIANWIASEIGLPLAPDVSRWPATANVCNNHDFVCDSSIWDIVNHTISFGVHTSYAKQNKNGTYSYEPVLTSAATWDAGKVYDQIISKPGPACGLS
jgi:hypothetical protein